jgi:hypothetical protein
MIRHDLLNQACISVRISAVSRMLDFSLEPRVCRIGVVASMLLVAAPNPQAAPKREEIPRVPLVVRVIDATTRQPVAGIDVTCTSTTAIEAETVRRWCDLQKWLDAIELDEVARALGSTRKSD